MKHRNILILLSIIIGILLIIAALYVFKKPEDKEPEIVNIAKEVEKIEGYSYTLDDRDTKLFKDNFKELKNTLERDSIDYKEYASILSKLYVIDLYTIDNKINQYDVGSLEYVHPDIKDNFDKKVKETIYRFVEDNSYGKRTQKLPIVKSVEIKEAKEEKHKIGEKEYDGYTVELTWEYETDYGYDKTAKLELVKIDKILYIIRQKNEDTQE